MPIYEYKCEKCENEFELLCKFGDDGDKECPKCGTNSIRQVASKVGLKFKGDGFYITDYKNKKPSMAPKEEVKEKVQAKKPECSSCDSKTKNSCDKE